MPYLDPIDTHGEARERRRQAAIDDRERARDREGWGYFMADRRGRRLLRRLVRFCGVFDSSYTGSSDTYFREGRRDIGLFILSQIREHAPEQYGSAVMEQGDDERQQPDD